VRIGLDIDGVMYKWDKTARYMLREVLPDSPYKETLKQEAQHWDWIKDNVSPEHWDWLWTEGVRLGLFRYGHLYSGTIQAVRKLATLGEVVLITHRPKQAVNDTLDWLAFQQLPISGVHLLTNMEPKSQVQPECDVYLDDKAENVLDLAKNTSGEAYLMRRPWNMTLLPTAPSVVTWDQFVNTIRYRRRVQWWKR